MIDTKKGLRNTQSDSEVRSFLTEAFARQSEMVVWLRDENQNLLYQSKAKIELINEKGEIKFLLDMPVPESNGLEFYFAFTEHTAVFKSPPIKTYRNSVIILLPNEIRYIERRKSKRIKPKRGEKLAIDITFTDKDNVVQKSLVYVYDYSESGISFIVTKETLQKIDTSLVIHFKSHFPQLVSGSLMVKNIRLFKGQKITLGETYAIGCHFLKTF